MLFAFRRAVNPIQPIRNRRGVPHAPERRRERGTARPPRAYTLLPASNLREGCGRQEQIRNIRNDFTIGVARSCAELLPLWVGDKHRPVLVALLKVGKGQHVSQVRQPCPDQRLAEEDGPEAGAAENGDLSLIEHFDFFLVRLPAVTLVDAQLEDARLVGCGSRWHLQPWNGFKSYHQRVFDPDVRGTCGRSVREGSAGFQVLLVVGQARGGGRERFQRWVRKEYVERRAVGSEYGIENAARTDVGDVH